LQNHVLIFTTDSSDKHGFLCLFLAKPRWWGLHPWGFFDYSLLRKQACPKRISSNPHRLSPAHHLYAKSQDAPSELTQSDHAVQRLFISSVSP